MIAVIAGATGLTGSILLRKLLEDEAVTRVISVSRSSAGVASGKLQEVLLADFAALPSVADELRGDLYFCCLGSTMKAAGSRERFRKVDHDAVLEFARIARSHEARSFAVITAKGASPRSAFFYNRVKGETERDLQALGLRLLLIFRPGLLLGRRRERRPAEQFFQRLLAPAARSFPWLSRSWLTPADVLADSMLRHARTAAPGTSLLEAGAIR